MSTVRRARKRKLKLLRRYLGRRNLRVWMIQRKSRSWKRVKKTMIHKKKIRLRSNPSPKLSKPLRLSSLKVTTVKTNPVKRPPSSDPSQTSSKTSQLANMRSTS